MVAPRRVASIDILRGLVMVLMTLDHVRDFLGDAAANPTNLATTTAPLFVTRWITHFCAPVFFLLTGTGASLMSRHARTASLAWFLATRGLWLIFLETVILRCLGYQFNVDFRVTVFFILWAIGWSMITLAALVWLPRAVILAFGLLLIGGHNLSDGVQASALGLPAWMWLILHQQGLLLRGPEHFILVAYPLIPWVGVTAAGYALGAIFEWEPAARRQFLWRAGVSIVAAFVILRWLNVYGDPQPWSARASAMLMTLSFINTTKYPPSLLFLLMTVGPALLVLRAIDARIPRWLRPVEVLGRVPLFYFALHIVLIHLIALLLCWLRYGEIHWMFESPTPDKYPFTQPPGWPIALPYIYVGWWIVVLALWPVCRWFAALKQRRREWWLSYI